MAVQVEREIPAVTAAVGRLVDAMRGLTTEMSALRSENEHLHAEVIRLRAVPKRRAREVSDGAGRTRSAANGRGTGAAPGHRRTPGAGRSTPPEVTDAVVRAALSKLGEATAGEIAAEITRAGTRVSGRAIRFLAERTGAQVNTDSMGQRRYRLG